MGKLIYVDELREAFSHDIMGGLNWDRILREAKTVDAVEVRHGRWETDGMMMDDGEYLMTRCTACGEAYEYGYNMPFCPHCGARMDGKGDGNETD